MPKFAPVHARLLWKIRWMIQISLGTAVRRLTGCSRDIYVIKLSLSLRSTPDPQKSADKPHFGVGGGVGLSNAGCCEPYLTPSVNLGHLGCNHSRLHRLFIKVQFTSHKVTSFQPSLISDSGTYLTSLRQRKMKTVCFVFLCVSLVFGHTSEEKSVSVMEGENITLPSDVKQPNETMRWYFNGTLIALINGDPSKSCLYDGPDGIFRDRLEVDYKTGSLTITNITTQHAGRYEAENIRGNSTGKIMPLNRKSKCDSTKIINESSNSGNAIKLFNVHVNDVPGSGPSPAVPGSGPSPAAVAGIVVVGVVVGVLLLAAAVVAGVMIYRHRRSRNTGRRNNEGVL